MLRKKIITRCPKCRSALNPRRFIGTVGLCDKCDWAGSYHSVNYQDWIQMKVSFILVVAGLLASYAIIRIGLTPEPNQVKPISVVDHQAHPQAHKKTLARPN